MLYAKFLIFVVIPFLSCTSIYGESCAGKTVLLSPSAKAERNSLLREIATSMKVSVVSELRLVDPPTPKTVADLERHEVPLMNLIGLLQPGTRLLCSLDDGVLHIYDAQVASARENPLNHVFAGFSIPHSAELFVMAFRARLNREGFRKRGDDVVSGSNGGAIGSDESPATLKEELLLNMAARDVFSREAKQVPMLLSVELTIDPAQDPATPWRDRSSKNLVIEVVKPLKEQ